MDAMAYGSRAGDCSPGQGMHPEGRVMDVNGLESELLEYMKGLPDNEYADDVIGRHTATTEVATVESFAWVPLKGHLSADNDAPWSDSWSHDGFFDEHRDWVGLAEALPESPDARALNGWSLRRSKYSSEDWKFEISAIRRKHSGEQARGLIADGVVEVAKAEKLKSKSDEFDGFFTLEERTLEIP
jgi:hypothetical protein